MLAFSARFSNWYAKLPKKIVIALISLLIVTYLGYVDKSIDFIGKSYVNSYNEDYIESVEQQSINVFMVISATLSTLAILKSSTAGFSLIFDLNIQYGGLFESLYLLVKKGWNASFVALAVIGVIKLFLTYSTKLASTFLFSFLSIMLARNLVTNVNSRIYNILGQLKNMFLFLTLICYILTPLYVSSMALVSRSIDNNLNSQVTQKLEILNKDLEPESPAKMATKSRSYIKDMTNSFSEIKVKIISASKTLIEHIITVMLTAIVIPLTFLIFIYLSFKAIFRRNNSIKNMHHE